MHIGIIPDGNRRWCKKNNVSLYEMIDYWLEKIDFWKTVVDEENNFDEISEISLYILTRDNIEKRNDRTLEMVYDLIRKMNGLVKIIHFFRIIFVGDFTLFDEDIHDILLDIQERTKNNKILLTCGVGYDPKVDLYNLTHGEKREQSDIDLVIRYGGEQRSSGFFPYHTLNSEWIYLQKLWPEVVMEDIKECIIEFNKRQRRLGG